MRYIARHAPLLATLTLLGVAACEHDPTADAPAPPVAVVDSMISIEEALRRFRADLPGAPAALGGGMRDRDALVREVVRAIAENDTLALERVALTRAEFAYLYYPSAPIRLPPYELPPALAWFQLQGNNRKGVFRALREYGGRNVDYRTHDCATTPRRDGENRVWTGCTVTLVRDGGEPERVRLFGSILERDGRFEILSYANDL